ncbi:MAG: hypothetical protein JNM63_10670 [Spirochaetia bacterium]|nr:hypothetical protein [Spirochaetia bacterium]
MFFRISLFLLSTALIPAGLQAVPPLLKQVLETNTVYESRIVSKEVWAGRPFIVSNHISRRGINVGGKIVVLVAEGKNTQLSPEPKIEPGTNGRDEADELKNFVEKLPDAIAVTRTDMRGNALFSVKPSAFFGAAEECRIRVLFINQSGFFAEHQVVHLVRVVSPFRFWGTFASPFILMLAMMAFVGIAWRNARSKKGEFPQAYYWIFPHLIFFGPVPLAGSGEKKKESKLSAPAFHLRGLLWFSVLAAFLAAASYYLKNPILWALLGTTLLFSARRIRESGPFTPLLIAGFLGALASLSAFFAGYGSTGLFQNLLLQSSGYPYGLYVLLVLFPAAPFFLGALLSFALSGNLSWVNGSALLAALLLFHALVLWKLKRLEKSDESKTEKKAEKK